ncbi:LysR substrate-binding domain-containing protein [Sphingosinicella sp. LHD-64]|uniref:LysR substrate-binding domain-containing protein n=1 Tax=Sphingosinicella sp. LHD-64 TaxID=3072139 RepID=UPI00280F3B6B|nr:LysR substrate-binding domain-containing protein [Sphingosinicella sp. LHD-64]MDQ8757328.1 LysR substrate-binding domain-containing protein [Sphingosinicella sp. LHD-64]
MPRHPPVESLRVLEACVRHASFTRAATELGVTPAAVSARMRNLEADLGTALFARHGPRIVPTGTAAALAAEVADALRLMHAAVGRSRATPVLRVTAPPSFAQRWLAPRLARYRALPGAAEIVLDVATDLRDPATFDLAIRTGRGGWPGFDAIPLLPVQATAMLCPALAAEIATPADLTRMPLIPHPDWPRWFAAAGIDPPPGQSDADGYPTYEIDAAAALAGAGAALLPPNLYGALISEGRLVQPFPLTLDGPDHYYLLRRAGDDRPALLSFGDWILAEAGA